MSKKPTHRALKQSIVRAVEDAYETAYKHDVTYQAKKPAILKRVDAKVTKLLRPLFTAILLSMFVRPAAAQIPIDQLQIVNSPDVRGWAPTATISRVEFRSAGIHFDFDKLDTWPDVTPPGWTGPIRYTVWLLLNVDGHWYGSGIIEFWRDRASTDDTDVTKNNQIANNWLYDSRWGPMAGHQPQAGELVGFMLTAGDARGKDVHAVTERSRIVELAWPSGPSVPAFTWMEGGVTVPPVITPPPVVIPPPVVTPPPIVIDYSTVLQQILASERQLLDAQQQLLVVAKDTNAQVTELNKSFAQTVGQAAAFIGKYIAPAVSAWLLAKKFS